MKQMTIKDIAKKAGVSVASVSRVLNRMDGINEKERSRILRVCERFSYTPNGLARSLVKRRVRTIGTIMSDTMSPFYSEPMVKASDAVHKGGYQVLPCNSFRELGTKRNYLKLLIERQVEGILILPIGPRNAESTSELIHNVPMMALNEPTGRRGTPYVCVGKGQAGRIVIEYLISGRYKSLLFAGLKPERLAHRCRVASFVETARAKRTPAQIYECSLDFRIGSERGYNHFKHFLRSGLSVPGGTVATSDATASDIIRACRENGTHIPEDLSLIELDNVTEELLYTRLTTMTVSHEEQIETAAELLLGMVEGGTLVGGRASVKLEPRLAERRSCRG